MPKVDADAPLTESFLLTSVTYGVSRSGKTTFNSSFPKPAIFASAREGGYKSIQTMDPELRYERKVKPLIYVVSTMKETLAYFREVEGLVKQGKVATICFELSFYSDDLVRSLTKENESNGWAKYKTLEDHIQYLDMATKRMGVRLAYNSLAVDPGDAATKSPGGLQIAGKAIARKLPAGTDMTGFLRTEDRGNNQIDRVLHMSNYGAYPAGHRYGKRLPPVVRNPTFRKLEDLLAERAYVDDNANIIYGAKPTSYAASSTPDLEPISGLEPLVENAADLPPL